MIVKVVCNYCGDEKLVKDGQAKNITIRCPKCNSKRVMKEYIPFDGYVGCPSFPTVEDKTSDIVLDYSSYGDIYGGSAYD
jgi:DNA-directed RNA polymerase subunit RPC12/RpoP